jgi:hypothetical protein
MSLLTDTILTTSALALRYAESLLKDIEPARFARLPSIGGTTIHTNHPAWVYGHLSLYPGRVLAMLGRPGSGPANPPRFEDLFKGGTPCLDDPSGTVYPSMEAITAHFFAAMRAAQAALPSVSDEALARANPVEGRLRDMFPTIAGAANFMLGAHVMSHLGQVSAWRRCMGLGPVM